MIGGTGTRIVLVNCRNLPEARKIAKSVVMNRLAACANVATSPVDSFYWWGGKVDTAREYTVVIKTTVPRLAALEKEVKRLHSYDVPEFIVVEITAGSKEYLRWVKESVARSR